jgi:hypothetical protein
MTAAVEASAPLTPEQIHALPAVTDAEATICAVWGIKPSLYFRLLADGELPVPTHRIGRKRKVYRADVLRAIGETNGDGAGAATPTPPAETHTPTSSDQ